MNVWVEFFKDEIEYDEFGNTLVEVLFFWDEETEVWIKDSKNDHYYSSLVTGINDVGGPVSYKLYPNPTSGNFNLSFEEEAGPLTIVLLNTNGQIIYREQFRTSSGFYSINLPQLPKGMYLVKVQGDGFVKTEKLVVR